MLLSLLTPDTGLLFWMLIIFGTVFFILAKFGFPVITQKVEERTSYIKESLEQAEQARAKMEEIASEQQKLIDQAQKKQSEILKEATKARSEIIAQAKDQALQEAEGIIQEARTRIAAEKESAIRDVRKEIALLSVGIAEKVIRKELDSSNEQKAYIEKLSDEAAETARTRKVN